MSINARLPVLPRASGDPRPSILPHSCRHTGTFRGNNLALVSGKAALNLYWRNQTFSQQVRRLGAFMRRRLDAIAHQHGNRFAVRGRGMVCGFDCKTTEIAEATSHRAFEKGLIIERCGPTDQVVKFLPALTIEQETLGQGLDIFEESLTETLNSARAS
nr:aminotransferase class III-fold pyridoxal phosphate-dependent enzyme [Bradyrhizobium sp. 179]